MAAKKGFTILEVLVVLIIVSALIGIIVPYYTNSIWQSKVQAVENNLRAIGAKEQKYSEDHNGAYYASAVQGNDFGNINSKLSLSLAAQNDGFNYTCAASGTCCASNTVTPNTAISVDAKGNLTVSPGGACVSGGCAGVIGCDGVCNSGKVNDACGVCGGNGSSCAPCGGPNPCGSPGNCTAIPNGKCDCSGDVNGCDGVCNSGKVNDVCGVCGGNGSSCAGCGGPTPCGTSGNCTGYPNGACDCAGDVNGCDGVCNSGKVNDACGVCGGNGSSCAGCGGPTPCGTSGNCTGYPNGACDCAGDVNGCDGVCNSGKVNDACGVCGGNGSSCAPCGGPNPCGSPGNCTAIPNGKCDCSGDVNGCDGVCNSGKVNDVCGVCGGNGSSCAGCGGPTPCGTSGNCTGYPNGACDCAGDVNGCDGVCNSSKVNDVCGVCGGTGIPAGKCDCAGDVNGCDGVCNSGKVNDACGVCGGNGSSCVPCGGPNPCGSPGNCTPIPNGACDCAGDVNGCDGVCNSGKMNDACGVCGGNGSSCAPCGGPTPCGTSGNCTGYPNGACDCTGDVNGCDGVCNSGKVNDICGNCGGPGYISGSCDCTPGHTYDSCGTCGGNVNCGPGSVCCASGPLKCGPPGC